MKSVNYKLIELFIIFILLPVSFAITFSIWIKLAIGFLGFGYVIYVLLKVEGCKFKLAPHLNWKSFWKQTFLKFVIIAFVTIRFV